MQSDTNILQIENLSKYFGGLAAVSDCSLKIKKGSITGIIGPNGSGKTTTAKMILNIMNADEGQITRNTNKMAYVPQKITIDWTMPLRVIDFMKITNNLNNNQVLESLTTTGVDKLLYNQIHNLSGGEFQRVLIARAIAKKPDLLVLDEPVQGVDYNGEIALYNLIKKISVNLNCGILLISHDMHFVMSTTNHVICLNGHICCSGTPGSVVKNPEYIKLFGEHNSETLSYYQHHHDHSHENDGSVSN